MFTLYAGEWWLQIVVVTGVIGGGAAWLAGRAIAHTWRAYWQLIPYMILLGAGVRFVHFALFQANPASVPSYVIDTAYLVAVASLAFRITRVTQMVRQYPWLYQRDGLLRWRGRQEGAEKSADRDATLVTSGQNRTK